MNFNETGEVFDMNIEIPHEVVDEAARLIREESLSAPAASRKAYKSYTGQEASEEIISAICSNLQERKENKRKIAQEKKEAEEQQRIEKLASDYNRAKWGE